ncbi:alpha-1,2-fucosyltransferase [Pirellula sp. SH-Sr6A]|uniref:alpha-1,2-fucosyltransferase n=1 Tax=Pirellula sp. SH-Sr6A TaxID=1632865 RepID=UPI00143A7C22|nr:alpha-1,2-fucosyltransferase [Pirellula sp. SH-Sr6A]
MHKRKPVVKLLLCGGLGNQLFQYAYARCLAVRTGSKLVLDTKTLFQTDTRYRRRYELAAFNLSSDVEYSNTSGLLERARFYLYRHFAGQLPARWAKGHFIEESHLGVFDESQYNLFPVHSITLKGYWQCPQYFDSIENALKDELTLKPGIVADEENISVQLKGASSVGIHVRRNDYARCLSSDYYRVAMQRMREQVASPRFFVFSDDFEWWRNQFGDLPDVEFVSRIGKTAIDDFHLLSLCAHFIIPNSTFSWWAAWLGRSPDKIVIAPSKSIWVDSSEILPRTWQIIEVREKSLATEEVMDSQEYGPA